MSGLLFYMHDGPSTFRFELSGNLAGAEVGKLEQAWKTASSTMGDKILAVDVTYLADVDGRGRALLDRWNKIGAHFVASSPASRALVESVTGRPYAQGDPAVGPTFDVHFTGATLRAAFLALCLTVTMLFPQEASAADAPSALLERYGALVAEQSSADREPVAVEIEASVAKLDKQARVEAIRRWSDGKKQYQFIAVEGDSFVRNEMIARYFTIEDGGAAAPITKSNYKFKFVANRENVSVFHITPRRKRLGMIDGELWIDNRTGQVTHVSGRLVKSPSLLLRRIEMSQETNLGEGAMWARETHFHISTRFTGSAEINIREHAYAPEAVADEVIEDVTP